MLGAITFGCSADRPDIILISIDTLRPDHLGLYGYERPTSPNLDRWFADAARFERCYATEASTSPSVVSMLSGRYPDEHRVRLLYQLVPPDLELVTDWLPDEYQTAAVVSNIVLTDEASGLARYFQFYDDFVDEKEPYRVNYERNARRTTDAALRWLREARDPERPLFLWVHYIDPHGPYHPPDDWTPSFTHVGFVPLETERVLAYQIEPGIDDALTYVDRYDEEIAYMDAHVGRLMDVYAETRPIDEAFVVFTSDHGESMIEHERWFTHGYHVYDEIARVPLLIRGPGIAAGSHDALVSGIDVVPTILRMAGVSVPSELRGYDLADPGAVPRDRMVFTEGTQEQYSLRAAVQGQGKWIALIAKGSYQVLDRRFYDLAGDPEEMTQISWDDREGGAGEAGTRLLELIASDPDPGGLPDAYSAGMRLRAPKIAPRVSEEDLERLRSLGYVN